MMPTYEYRCEACGYKFEMLRSRSERDEPAECPECGAIGGRRLMSACFMRTRTEGGGTAPVGGSPCASCSATSCAGCSVK